MTSVVTNRPPYLRANLGNCPVTLERIEEIRERVRKRDESDWGVHGDLELSTLLRVGLLAVSRLGKAEIVGLCVDMNADEAARWREWELERLGEVSGSGDEGEAGE